MPSTPNIGAVAVLARVHAGDAGTREGRAAYAYSTKGGGSCDVVRYTPRSAWRAPATISGPCGNRGDVDGGAIPRRATRAITRRAENSTRFDGRNHAAMDLPGRSRRNGARTLAVCADGTPNPSRACGVRTARGRPATRPNHLRVPPIDRGTGPPSRRFKRYQPWAGPRAPRRGGVTPKGLAERYWS